MVITLQQLERAVVTYAEREVAPKGAGINKFLTYMMIPSLPDKVGKIIVEHRDFMERYFDPNGNIEVDCLYRDAKQAMQKMIQLELYGIIFKEEDIDLLYKYAREQ